MNNVLDNILGRMEEAQKNNRRFLLVIDGKCGSGKTTLSEWLGERYGCNVFLPADNHADSRGYEGTGRKYQL